MTLTGLTPKRFLGAIACVFAIALRPAAATPAVQAGDARLDVTGTWAFQVETSGGSGTPTMTFKQDGEKLTGHYSGQLGEAPLTGTVKGNTAEKDSMKGTVKLGDFDGTFTAKKKS